MPEEKKRFTAARGARVEVGISGDDEETARPARRAEEGESRAGALFEDGDDEPLQRRGRLSIEVFDLGTRLRSVPPADFDAKRVRLASELSAAEPSEGNFNEYVELEVARAGGVEVVTGGGGFDRVNLTDAERDELGAQMLGEEGDALDAFGDSPANVTGRKVPNAMPFPYQNNFQVDLMVGEKRYPLAARADFAESDRNFPGDGEPVPEDALDAWKAREPKEEDASERWNPYSRGEGESIESHGGGPFILYRAINPAFGQGTLKPKGGAGSRLAVAHGFNETPPTSNVGFGLYETFDTSDAGTFKVTREPSFAAEEVTFRLPSARVRLYLKPRFVMHYSGLFTLNAQTRPLGDAFAFVGREPVYPFPPVEDLRVPSVATVSAYMARTPAARETLQRLRTVYSGPPPNPLPVGLHSIIEYAPEGSFFTYLNYSQAGMLVGVIVAGSARFYVWRRATDAERFAAVYLMTGVSVPELLPYL